MWGRGLYHRALSRFPFVPDELRVSCGSADSYMKYVYLVVVLVLPTFGVYLPAESLERSIATFDSYTRDQTWSVRINLSIPRHC